jgi:hypothetical protein
VSILQTLKECSFQAELEVAKRLITNGKNKLTLLPKTSMETFVETVPKYLFDVAIKQVQYCHLLLIFLPKTLQLVLGNRSLSLSL